MRRTASCWASVSSDAAVQHYETWGLYGASKAALDHVTLTYAAETGLRAYAVDPGDMRTAMHQDAFPGEDISDRPLPTTVVPRLLALLDARPGAQWRSGRGARSGSSSGSARSDRCPRRPAVRPRPFHPGVAGAGGGVS